jgi:hypothetical protein
MSSSIDCHRIIRLAPGFQRGLERHLKQSSTAQSLRVSALGGPEKPTPDFSSFHETGIVRFVRVRASSMSWDLLSHSDLLRLAR